jgi:ATP-independent RNA helicase DbpA
VAARGLDIKALPLVLAYELPGDADVHTHRIGRTGRAGETGMALSLVAPGDSNRVQKIEALLGTPLTWSEVPRRDSSVKLPAPLFRTLAFDAGRQDKLRPGDIVGALTGDGGLHKDQIGKIALFATRAYVAVAREVAGSALQELRTGKIKGRRMRVRSL